MEMDTSLYDEIFYTDNNKQPFAESGDIYNRLTAVLFFGMDLM